MPGPTASRKRRGRRGPCSYCHKVHKKGKRRGDSCKGHVIRGRDKGDR